MVELGISLGELVVIGGVGVMVVGKQNLPQAFHFLGSQVGRIVGLLQGTRIRADRLAQDKHLRSLQNELRMGLRELDAVKGEFAMAASSRVISGGVMSSASSLNTNNGSSIQNNIQRKNFNNNNVENGKSQIKLNTTSIPSQTSIIDTISSSSSSTLNNTTTNNNTINYIESTRTQSVAAIAEEEWAKSGMSFKARGEMSNSSSSSSSEGGARGGSFLLADVLQQSLIHDQYDRVTQEQDELLQNKVADKIATAKTSKSKDD